METPPVAEVVLQDVRYRYPGSEADTLHAVELTIAAGSRHALLGSSGAGKSTLLNLLSGLIAPSAGRILLDGRDVSALAPAARNVAQVFQFPVLYESLTVAKNLEFPLRVRGVAGRERQRRAQTLAEQLEIEPLLGALPRELSLFQKQLVAIGRALVRADVALVLLDEPLTAVEPATKWRLRRLLKAVQAQTRATMIYVTHDQTEALTFADQVSVVQDGRLLQTGTPEALYDDPADEHVAHFIGSPGMNLVPAEARDGALLVAGGWLADAPGVPDGPCVAGFRPEWAVARPATDNGDGLAAAVQSLQVQGAEAGQLVGLVELTLGAHRVLVRQPLDTLQQGPAALHVHKVLTFRGGKRLERAA